jgi:hypothetical protein
LNEVVPSKGGIIAIVSGDMSLYYWIIPFVIFSENKRGLI